MVWRLKSACVLNAFFSQHMDAADFTWHRRASGTISDLHSLFSFQLMKQIEHNAHHRSIRLDESSQ